MLLANKLEHLFLLALFHLGLFFVDTAVAYSSGASSPNLVWIKMLSRNKLSSLFPWSVGGKEKDSLFTVVKC
jgi:hypothetical protein